MYVSERKKIIWGNDLFFEPLPKYENDMGKLLEVDQVTDASVFCDIILFFSKNEFRLKIRTSTKYEYFVKYMYVGSRYVTCKMFWIIFTYLWRD